MHYLNAACALALFGLFPCAKAADLAYRKGEADHPRLGAKARLLLRVPAYLCFYAAISNNSFCFYRL